MNWDVINEPKQFNIEKMLKLWRAKPNSYLQAKQIYTLQQMHDSLNIFE